MSKEYDKKKWFCLVCRKWNYEAGCSHVQAMMLVLFCFVGGLVVGLAVLWFTDIGTCSSYKECAFVYALPKCETMQATDDVPSWVSDNDLRLTQGIENARAK